MVKLEVLKEEYKSIKEAEEAIEKELAITKQQDRLAKLDLINYSVVTIEGRKYSIVNQKIFTFTPSSGVYVNIPERKTPENKGKIIMVGASATEQPYNMDKGVIILAIDKYTTEYEVGDKIIFRAGTISQVGHTYNADAKPIYIPNFMELIFKKDGKELKVASINSADILGKLEDGIEFDTWQLHNEMIELWNRRRAL
jgi:hypothetical protein